ncbi:MAG: (d)CMP kinase [Gemmatimonadota bacterium]|nr:(d)CMP kinase [Gemmatimonadota bacterium]
MVIAIDGPAASGKSSTASWVARELGFRHLDSGMLYREETAQRLGIQDLRSPAVTAAVSAVAQLPEVRMSVNAELRRIAEIENVVVDGRDIGSVVFPEADLKIFLIADPWERARRRLHQRLGRPAADSEIADETRLLVERDARDATNTQQARDAVLIDTTYLTQEEQVQRIVALAQQV